MSAFGGKADIRRLFAVVVDVGRKRIKADVITGPAGTLQGRAFPAATGATSASAQLVLEAFGPHKITATAQASGA